MSNSIEEYLEEQKDLVFATIGITFVWLVRMIAVILFILLYSAAANASDIHFRNGVACRRILTPIHGSSSHRVTYEPIVEQRAIEVPEYKAPEVYPSERELLEYNDDEFDKALARILQRAQRDQSRRETIEQLRKLGLRLGDENYRFPADRGLYSRSQYPPEERFGISVKSSTDYIGSDPTDVIAAQIGRELEGVRGLFGDVLSGQSDALDRLIQSRAANSDRMARAIEKIADSQSRAAEIRAIGEATQRAHTDRQIDLNGILSGVTGSTQAPIQGGPDDEVQLALSEYCGKCHDPSRSTYQEGRIDLSDYTRLSTDQWSGLIRRIRSDSMPPQGEAPLSDAAERVLVDEFLGQLTK
jgi:hypothetical protein